MDKTSLFLVSVGVLSLGTFGCTSTRIMGISATPVAPAPGVPITCIEREGGDKATMIDGTIAGKPAVTIEGKSGFAPTLTDSVVMEGMTIYAGQTCQMEASPVCINAIVMQSPDARIFMHWNETYPAKETLPQGPAGIIRQWQTTPVYAISRSVDFDPPTLAAFIKLAEERRDAARLKTGFAFAGAALAVAGAASGKGGAKEGLNIAKAVVKTAAAVNMAVNEEDKPHVAAHPRMMPMFQTLSFLGPGASFCYARGPGGGPPGPPPGGPPGPPPPPPPG